MRILPLIVLALSPLLASADQFDRHVADITLLQVKEVQTELKITETQRKKMNGFADAHRSKLTSYETKLKADAQKAKKQVQPDEKILAGYFGSLKNSVISSLSDAQIKRLRELTLQRSGLTGILDQQVATKVGVNAASLKKLRDLYAAGAKEAASIEEAALKKVLSPYQNRKPKDEAEAKKLRAEVEKKMAAEAKVIQPRIAKVQQSTRDKMLATLTAKQKSTYQALQGKPFTQKPS
jgi:hypothetical protein